MARKKVKSKVTTSKAKTKKTSSKGSKFAKKKPVSIWGIEFDALIDLDESYEITVPTYPVESGYPISDNIKRQSPTLKMTLYLTDTPVTWLAKHGTSPNRVNEVIKKLRKAIESNKPTKIVTRDSIYTDMAITSVQIKKASGLSYAREISIAATKIVTTKKKTATVPKISTKSKKTDSTKGSSGSADSSSKDSTDATDGTEGADDVINGADTTKKHLQNALSSSRDQSILYGMTKGKLF